MQKVLLAALIFALHSFIFGSLVHSGEVYKQPQKLKYEYKIETDLSVEKFSDVFCKRLSTKHKWEKIGAEVTTDEIYTSRFRYKDENAHSWECEVMIRKDETQTRRMDVVMIMDPMLGS